MDEEQGLNPAPAAEPTESAPVETAEVEEVVEPPAEDAGAEPQKAKGVQKRIDELVRQREDERRRAERYEAMLHEMYAKQQAPPPTPQPQPKEQAPKLEDFPDYDSYILAAAKHEAKQELRQEMERQRREEDTRRQQSEQERTQQETVAKATKFMSKGREKYDDFGSVIESSTAPATPYMQQALIESDMGHEVAYYLAKNPGESERIASLSPLGQVRELTRLEIKLSAAPVKQTSAPAPITPVGAKNGVGAEPDATKNPDAWLEWERARVRAKGRRY